MTALDAKTATGAKVPGTLLCDCGHKESDHSTFARGYATTNDGQRLCYDCCRKTDLQGMHRTGRIPLYLTMEDCCRGKVGNWIGNLKFACEVKKGSHNIAGTRYDVWFTDQTGNHWHGVQYGENTQITHCRRLKG